MHSLFASEVAFHAAASCWYVEPSVSRMKRSPWLEGNGRRSSVQSLQLNASTCCGFVKSVSMGSQTLPVFLFSFGRILKAHPGKGELSLVGLFATPSSSRAHSTHRLSRMHRRLSLKVHCVGVAASQLDVLAAALGGTQRPWSLMPSAGLLVMPFKRFSVPCSSSFNTW